MGTLNEAITAIEEYVKGLNARVNDLVKEVGDAVVEELKIEYAPTPIGSEIEYSSELVDANKAVVTAKHLQIAFYEYGHGVTFNTPDTVDNRPLGMAGIGQYGLKRGKQKRWSYRDDSGKVVFTEGYPAVRGFYRALKQVRANLKVIASKSMET
jgi:hypothetical protein